MHIVDKRFGPIPIGHLKILDPTYSHKLKILIFQFPTNIAAFSYNFFSTYTTVEILFKQVSSSPTADPIVTLGLEMIWSTSKSICIFALLEHIG